MDYDHSSAQNNIKVLTTDQKTEWTLTPYYDKNDKLVGFAAYRDDTDNGIEYLLDAGDFTEFSRKIDNYTRNANFFYASGIPSDEQVAFAVGDYGEALKGMWSKALKSPQWWMTTISAFVASAVMVGEQSVMASETTNSRVFVQTAKEDDLIFYSTKVGDNIIEFGGNFSKSKGTLTITNFDVDGNMINKLGIKGIRDIMNDFGKQQGVSEIIIHGAKRTTGANPGRIPSQLIFKIK